jgi:hypothetical protein
MNDPWNALVEVLSGQRRPTPSAWAQRRVHRMCDDAPAVRPATRNAPAPARAGRPDATAPGGLDRLSPSRA